MSFISYVPYWIKPFQTLSTVLIKDPIHECGPLQPQTFPFPQQHYVPLQQQQCPRDPSDVGDMSQNGGRGEAARAPGCPLLHGIISTFTTICFRLGFTQKLCDGDVTWQGRTGRLRARSCLKSPSGPESWFSGGQDCRQHWEQGSGEKQAESRCEARPVERPGQSPETSVYLDKGLSCKSQSFWRLFL